MPHKGIWVNADTSQEIRTVEGNYSPPKGDLLLKTICVGVNPADYKHPEVFGAVETIEGFDVVGWVQQVGPDTFGFAPGDKVVTFTRGIGPPEWGGSQEYCLALAKTCWKLDADKLSEDQAATIPLTACTAGDGLYNRLKPPLPLPWSSGPGCDWPILLWGASAQVGIQAIQFAKASGCSPIVVTASPKQHEYLKSLGADHAFDYRDKDVIEMIKAVIPPEKHLKHAFDCVGTDIELLESTVEAGGSLVLALPPVRPSPNHHAEMAIAGTIHDLESFRAPEFKFHEDVEPKDSDGAITLQKLMTWTFEQVGKAYKPPKVRRLSGKGMYDAFECFALMRENKISAEKVVWRMSETPDL
ncbi:hypothetical protein FB567DRAFT_617346 [Paraphoma chrysanthemicola]|uniref:Enoyl reductase (ER) domain-containing protein n=1 Tax=Paraphoma chrysanthemicola TaxID=798071 RepID=A0A8K0RCT4_9PLEO|nr:hypothetical protein FB567DRAFT_617346 [Paraphoma chrysanthemicola]